MHYSIHTSTFHTAIGSFNYLPICILYIVRIWGAHRFLRLIKDCPKMNKNFKRQIGTLGVRALTIIDY